MVSPISRRRNFCLALAHLGFFSPGKETKLAWLSTTNTWGHVPTLPSAIPPDRTPPGMLGLKVKGPDVAKTGC